MRHRVGRRAILIRDRIVRRDGPMCAICFLPMTYNDGSQARMTVDHIDPVSHGGGNEIDNLRMVHSICNVTRGDKPVACDPEVATKTRSAVLAALRADRQNGMHTPPSSYTLTDPLTGDLSPMGAFMSGKIKVEGDMSIAMKLPTLFG